MRVGAHQFERAHDAGRARQLVEREQAQGIAHDHRDARAEEPRPGQPPVGDDEGGEAEIGLGLAAARREEQQVGDLAVRVGSVGQAGEVEQDEGELERSPFRRRLCVRIAARARIAVPRRIRHREIHETEGSPRDVVAGQDVDSFDHPLARALHFGDEPLRRLAPAHR